MRRIQESDFFCMQQAANDAWDEPQPMPWSWYRWYVVGVMLMAVLLLGVFA